MDNQYRNQLIEKITRATTIANSLEACEGFRMACEDVAKTTKMIDDNWHLIAEDDKWLSRIKELRISKLSSSYITNMVSTYRADVKVAEDELTKLDNPDSMVNKDYDNDGNYEQPEEGVVDNGI